MLDDTDDDSVASTHMCKIVDSSMNAISTKIYDVLQSIHQGINY